MSSPWHIFHVRKRTPFYVSIYSQGIAHGKINVLDFDYHIKFFHINGQVAMKEAEFQKQRRMVQKRLKRDPRFLLKLMQWHYRKYKSIIPLIHQIKKTNPQTVSNAVLAQQLLAYVRVIGEFWTVGVVPLYVEQDLTDQIQRFVERRLSPEEATNAMQVFLTPLKEGIVGEEHRQLLHVAMLPKNKQPAALERHSKKYAWMANQLFTHSFFPPSYYRKRLVALTQTKAQWQWQQYIRERKELRASFRTFMQKLHPNASMRTTIMTLNEAIFYRSWRGEKPYETGYEIRAFLEEISRRLGLSAKDLLFCVPNEIAAWLRTGRAVPRSVIEARKKGFIYLCEQKDRILTGKFVRLWEQRVAIKHANVTEVHGTTAYPGLVRGIARIVHGAAELGKVKVKDILITPSTTPIYTPVLHKVQAIITEEGGVLSHASVIARELKIPCVIGTKIATRIFKDGDRVKVDAEHGVVKKL
ncbi:hypothetical protein HY624_02285 [Candidatus Uhrbacteria bacterium]|nr:hypothetical protein [Candidatus Uhrbacteria bacterium]